MKINARTKFLICCRPLRGLVESYLFVDPGVPLRFTPGRGPQPSISAGVQDFTLSPAVAGSLSAVAFSASAWATRSNSEGRSKENDSPSDSDRDASG